RHDRAPSRRAQARRLRGYRRPLELSECCAWVACRRACQSPPAPVSVFALRHPASSWGHLLVAPQLARETPSTPPIPKELILLSLGASWSHLLADTPLSFLHLIKLVLQKL